MARLNARVTEVAAQQDPALIGVTWLREIGFEEVDCYWKWRDLALLVGKRQAK